MTLERGSISGLHEFAGGALDFLIGAAALSIVIGLVSAALEDVARPFFQGPILYRWTRDTLGKRRPIRKGTYPSREESFDDELYDFFIRRGVHSLPTAFLRLPPDQLCAQVIRQFQTADTGIDEVPYDLEDFRSKESGWARWGEIVETAVDELQVRLTRAVRQRSYLFAALIAAAFGLILYVFQNGRFDAPRIEFTRVAVLTVIFGAVAVLLSPIVQVIVARSLRTTN